MTDPLATRALFALYRNHPSTAPGDRYGVKAHRHALAQRDMLLAWAATVPDDRLLDCRNLGATALSWIREHQNDAPHRLRCIDCGQEIGPGMVPCPTPGLVGTPQEYAKGYRHGYEDGRAAALAGDALRAVCRDCGGEITYHAECPDGDGIVVIGVKP